MKTLSVLGDNLVADDGVSIWSNSIVDYGGAIGNRVKIHSNCYIAQFTEIEDEVFLAPGVVAANDLYPQRADSARLMSGPTLRIGAQIGANSTLLPYVTVGVRALAGAGSVVTRYIPDGMVAYGCPAVPVRAVDALEPISASMEPVEGAARRFRRRTRGDA